MTRYPLTIPSQWIGPPSEIGVPAGSLSSKEKFDSVLLIKFVVQLHYEAAVALEIFQRAPQSSIGKSLGAKSFIMAAAGLAAAIRAIGELLDIQAEVLRILTEFNQTLGPIQELRNSIAHADERIRLLKSGKKPIKIENSDAIMFGIIRNDTYRSLLADGTNGEVTINEKAMTALNKAVKDLIAVIEWDPNGIPEDYSIE